MTKIEAKRRVCSAFAAHMDNGSENVWLRAADDGSDLPEADQRRMQEAFDELVLELKQRGRVSS